VGQNENSCISETFLDWMSVFSLRSSWENSGWWVIVYRESW
jgi:hypothetical protein